MKQSTGLQNWLILGAIVLLNLVLLLIAYIDFRDSIIKPHLDDEYCQCKPLNSSLIGRVANGTAFHSRKNLRSLAVLFYRDGINNSHIQVFCSGLVVNSRWVLTAGTCARADFFKEHIIYVAAGYDTDASSKFGPKKLREGVSHITTLKLTKCNEMQKLIDQKGFDIQFVESTPSEDHFCAINVQTGICPYDIGGPLYYTSKEHNKLYVAGIARLIGIYNDTCGLNFSAGYTYVYPKLEWIKKMVENQVCTTNKIDLNLKPSYFNLLILLYAVCMIGFILFTVLLIKSNQKLKAQI